MNFPKRIIIAGREWKVKRDSSLAGVAFFDSFTATISLGKKYGEGEELEAFLHEVVEAILQDRGHRYHYNCDGDNDKRIFVFNHAQFTNVIRDLAGAVRLIVKQEKK